MTRLDKVKTQLKDNKKTYLVGAGALVVGVVGTAVLMQINQVVINDSLNLNILSPKTNIVVTTLERRGHPGNIIKCVQTGEYFASQNRAAAANGINPSSLSKQLSGAIADVHGLTFVKMGEAV